MPNSTANVDRSGLIALAVMLGLGLVLVGFRIGGAPGMGIGLFIALWVGLLVAIARAPEKASAPAQAATTTPATPLPTMPIDAPATLADALGTPLQAEEIADLGVASDARVA